MTDIAKRTESVIIITLESSAFILSAKFLFISVFDQCTPTPSDTILVDVITGLDQPVNNSITVFPNPAKDFLTVKSYLNDITKIELSDYIGRVVYTQEGLRTSLLTFKISSF